MALPIDLTGRKQTNGQLKAIKALRVVPKRGVLWLCKCKCGNTREVCARDFASELIQKCIECVHPNRRKGASIARAKRARYRSQGRVRLQWRTDLIAFDRFRRILFEIYTNGRTDELSQREAVEVILTLSTIEVENELMDYEQTNLKRVQRALQRLAA